MQTFFSSQVIVKLKSGVTYCESKASI